MKRVKYLCYYDRIDADYKRSYILAATTKIDYIISSINRIGIGVDIISLAGSIENHFKWCNSSKNQYGNNTLTLFASFGPHNMKIFRVLNRWFIIAQFLLWCLLHLKKNDQVIVYHSLSYMNYLLLFRKVIGFSIIGEIEEIYTDVQKNSEKMRASELNFVQSCDKYLFPTHLLDKKYNTEGKPSVIIHGLYAPERNRNVAFNDRKIHVVYAGTFDVRKGGAAAAAAAAAHLPRNFHIHILGFGKKPDEEYLRKVINETAQRAEATVTFDGLLKGEDFIQFLQKCSIGLSTQDPTAAFNSTSFPSKVLTYLANGLKVVTIDIPAIRQSDVGGHLFYYSQQTPEEIAKAILKASKEEGFDSRELLRELDKKFVSQLSSLLQC